VEGKNLYDSESSFIKERRKFSFEGLVLVSIIINKDYSVEKNILLSARGLPEFDQLLILSEFKPIFIDAYLKLSNDQKSSDQAISELIKKNIRQIVKNYFQKKPEVEVHIFRN
jgi:ribonuclease J